MYVEILGDVFDVAAIAKNVGIAAGVVTALAAPVLMAACAAWMVW